LIGLLGFLVGVAVGDADCVVVGVALGLGSLLGMAVGLASLGVGVAVGRGSLVLGVAVGRGWPVLGVAVGRGRLVGGLVEGFDDGDPERAGAEPVRITRLTGARSTTLDTTRPPTTVIRDTPSWPSMRTRWVPTGRVGSSR